ncbi:allophanate hydrolase, partial [Klebsiella variicola]|nr:allophanate hydrolase [Klebsiella variicola]
HSAGHDRMALAVCGAHLAGLPLNGQLLARGGRLLQATHSAPRYRLYALADGKRPAMVRNERDGAAIAVEVWEIPSAEVGSLLAAIPAPLGLGQVELADGRWVTGFICEAAGLGEATEITAWGGWRQWLTR